MVPAAGFDHRDRPPPSEFFPDGQFEVVTDLAQLRLKGLTKAAIVRAIGPKDVEEFLIGGFVPYR